MKFAGKSKTISGGIVLFLTFILDFFQINYTIDAVVIENFFDGYISFQDVVYLLQALLGLGLVIYGRIKAKDDITFNPAKADK